MDEASGGWRLGGGGFGGQGLGSGGATSSNWYSLLCLGSGTAGCGGSAGDGANAGGASGCAVGVVPRPLPSAMVSEDGPN